MAHTFSHLLLKDDCDVCGCAWNWAGAGPSDGGHSDWATVDSVIVSAASPNWNFGARGAGIWKITSEQVYEAANNLPLTWFSYFDDLNWNSGGVTLDNSGGRDRSHHHQFYDVTNRYLQPNGHYSFGCAPRMPSSVANWGKGFDETGDNANINHESGAEGWHTYNTDGNPASGWDHPHRWRFLLRHYTPRNCGAVFVWMSDVNHYALPAKITGDASDLGTWPFTDFRIGGTDRRLGSNPLTRLKDIFRRQILPHSVGGTISGSISDVTADQRHTSFDLYANQRWKIRLHKLAPTPDTVWLENHYARALKGLRLKRWTGHIGGSGDYKIHCAWTFPLWSYDIILDRPAPAQMSECSFHHFKTSGGLGPYTWTPEGEWGNTYSHRGTPLGFAATDRAGAYASQSSLNPDAIGYAGKVGVVRDGAWSAWTVTPIFEDATLGEESILGADSANVGGRAISLSPDNSPIANNQHQYWNAGGRLGHYTRNFRPPGAPNIPADRRGCGFRAPTYLRGVGILSPASVGVGPDTGTREHNSMGVSASGASIGGVPVCVDFGVLGPGLPLNVRPDSSYLDTDGEAVSF
jgi:hypothetical protein